eukprot:5119262-Prymnesium_polylepis.1
MRTSARVWVAKSAFTFVYIERLRVGKRKCFFSGRHGAWGCAPALACASRARAGHRLDIYPSVVSTS